jgi:small subunit ribosomal protein S17
MKGKTIFGISAPAKECNDAKCPFHGSLSVKKKSFEGVVVSARMHNSAVVELSRRVFIKKYERYAKSRITIPVHNPKCIHAKEGDIVKIFFTRPLSKTIHFVIVENLGRKLDYEMKKAALEEGKFKKEEKVQEKLPEKEDEVS